MEDVLQVDLCSYLALCRDENILFSSKQTNMLCDARLFYLLPPRLLLPRDQTQPGTFSQEREEPGSVIVVRSHQPFKIQKIMITVGATMKTVTMNL